jgi:hypothetical protein
MWTYDQASGELTHDDAAVPVGTGYSGAGDCKNDPSQQCVPNEGPIPRGKYTICPPRDTTTHGPYVLALTPDPDNDMCGRAGFLMHGDKVGAPGTASQGCIIMPRPVRELVWASGDTTLTVV